MISSFRGSSASSGETTSLYTSNCDEAQGVHFAFSSNQDSTQLAKFLKARTTFPTSRMPPHLQRDPPALTKHLSAQSAGPAYSFRKQLHADPVKAIPLNTGIVIEMSARSHALIAKKACTRCRTQKRRCDRAIPDCGLCTRY